MVFRFLAVFIYASLITFSLIGAHVYYYAYNRMKHTKIIGSVALLFLALVIDSSFWFYTEFYRFIYDVYPNWAINPLTLIIVKSILLITLIRFILFSIRKNIIPIDREQKPLF